MIPDRTRATNAAVAWWRGLQPNAETGAPGNRAALARLRRAATVLDVMAEPETIDLFRRTGATAYVDLPAVALLAGVLAHVREDRHGQDVARLLGPERPDAPDTALMSPLRFRRLLEAVEPDERLAAFRRMVALADGRVPVFDLARSLLDWTEERRRRWIYNYWNAGLPVAAPAAEEPAR